MFRITFLLACLICSGHGALAADLRFAPLPMVNKETMASEFLGPVRHMADASGKTIELVYTQSYGELIRKFATNEIDFAFVGAFTYTMLRERVPKAEPIARFLEPNGEADYTCSLIVFGHTPITLSDLSGRRMALPDRLSPCSDASLLPMLHKAGVNIDDVPRDYLGRHDAVALGVVLGHYEVGGLKTAIAKKYRNLGVRIIAESPPVPGFVLVVNGNTVSAEDAARLRAAVLNLPTDSKLTRDWNGTWRNGAVPASDADFDALRARLTGLTIRE